jgi:hypothetical protein
MPIGNINHDNCHHPRNPDTPDLHPLNFYSQVSCA